jgi:hypothetical protein
MILPAWKWQNDRALVVITGKEDLTMEYSIQTELAITI